MKEKTEKRYLYELKKYQNSGKTLTKYIEEDIKDRKQLSKLFCGIKLTDIEFADLYDVKKLIKSENEKMNKYKRSNQEQFKLRKIQNTINRLKNNRLKIAYRLQLISGLRIDELSNLKENDISVKNGKILVNVREGKGGKSRKVECFEDKWVLTKLLELEPRKTGKLFYSPSYMKNMATKLNFVSHDLRKADLYIYFYNLALSTKEEDKRIELVQERAGHNKNSMTYKKYINRDINLTNTKYDHMKPIDQQ